MKSGSIPVPRGDDDQKSTESKGTLKGVVTSEEILTSKVLSED